MYYDLYTLSALKKVNDLKRIKLRDEASVLKSDFDKIQYIVNRFLQDYEFDYSSLRSTCYSEIGRKYKTKAFEYQGERLFSTSITSIKDTVLSREEDFDNEDKKPTNPVFVYHSVHALNMGTCMGFSAELDWFAKEFGIASERVSEYQMCYDGYEKTSQEREITLMDHYFNIMSLDGKEYKIDVAGAMMAKDYNQKYPEVNIGPKDFLFVDKSKKNPFNDIFRMKGCQPGE